MNSGPSQKSSHSQTIQQSTPAAFQTRPEFAQPGPASRIRPHPAAIEGSHPPVGAENSRSWPSCLAMSPPLAAGKSKPFPQTLFSIRLKTLPSHRCSNSYFDFRNPKSFPPPLYTMPCLSRVLPAPRPRATANQRPPADGRIPLGRGSTAARCRR